MEEFLIPDFTFVIGCGNCYRNRERCLEYVKYLGGANGSWSFFLFLGSILFLFSFLSRLHFL